MENGRNKKLSKYIVEWKNRTWVACNNCANQAGEEKLSLHLSQKKKSGPTSIIVFFCYEPGHSFVHGCGYRISTLLLVSCIAVCTVCGPSILRLENPVHFPA